MPGIIDALIVIVFGTVAYLVASGGVWSAVLMTFQVIVGGLVAMNFFEPLAELIEGVMGATWGYQADLVALLGIFAGTVGLLRLMTYQLSPDDIDVPEAFGEIGRWVCGGLCGWVTTCFLLTALHTAPLPREFIGFAPERKNLLNVIAPDRQWLGFTQYCSTGAFATRENVLVDGKPRIVYRTFDGPYIAVPGSNQEQWPSFPFRYATRREDYAGSGGSAPPPVDGGSGGGSPVPMPTGNTPDF